MKTKLIDGKKVIFKSTQNTPPISLIKKAYAGIPDNKRIPVVFETKNQYLNEYIANQERKNNISFTPSQKAEYKKTELKDMRNVVSRYTTNHNPYMEKRVVFFTDKKTPKKEFIESVYHEYGHEAWEKKPGLQRDWASVKRTTSPTMYGRSDRQEDFAESYMLFKQGKLTDPKRFKILKDNFSNNNNLDPIIKANSHQADRFSLIHCARCNKIISGSRGSKCVNCKEKEAKEKEGLVEDIFMDKVSSNNVYQSLFHAGNRPPSETLKQTGRVFGFSTPQQAKQWQEHKGKSTIYQFTSKDPDYDHQSYGSSKVTRGNEWIAKNIVSESEIKPDDVSHDSVADALGVNVPEGYESTNPWKFFGGEKTYDPRINESSNLKMNILDSLTRYKSSIRNAAMPMISDKYSTNKVDTPQKLEAAFKRRGIKTYEAEPHTPYIPEGTETQVKEPSSINGLQIYDTEPRSSEAPWPKQITTPPKTLKEKFLDTLKQRREYASKETNTALTNIGSVGSVLGKYYLGKEKEAEAKLASLDDERRKQLELQNLAKIRSQGLMTRGGMNMMDELTAARIMGSGLSYTPFTPSTSKKQLFVLQGNKSTYGDDGITWHM